MSPAEFQFLLQMLQRLPRVERHSERDDVIGEDRKLPYEPACKVWNFHELDEALNGDIDAGALFDQLISWFRHLQGLGGGNEIGGENVRDVAHSAVVGKTRMVWKGTLNSSVLCIACRRSYTTAYNHYNLYLILQYAWT